MTVRQPWAWAVLAGGMDVLNARRNDVGDHRGDLLIHAGQHLASQAAFARVAGMTDSTGLELGLPGGETAAQMGALLGMVSVESVHRAQYCMGRCSPWADDVAWHVMLARPRPLPRPIYCPGQTGLWTPVGSVLRQIPGAL